MFTTFSASPTGPRYTRACDTCRRLKIKCRNLRPENGYICDQCQRAELKCTYHEQPTRRGRPRKDVRSKEASHKVVAEPRRPPQAQRGDKLTASPPAITVVPPLSLPGLEDVWNQRGDEGIPLQTQELTVQPLQSDDSVFLDDIARPIAGRSPLVNSPDSVQTPSEIQVSGTQGHQEAWAGINEFFDNMYIIFPVISYVDLASRLILEPDWSTSPDLRTLVYTIRLWNSTGRYRADMQNETELRDLIHDVETSRLSYDFADPATLDAVVCSLALFTAYNVLGKHNRAFMYLSEAIFLLDEVTPASRAEEERRLRIERVLFNTESATIPIYATGSARRRAKRPPAKWKQKQPFEQDTLCISSGVERAAMHLLDRLTQIYLADGADELDESEFDSEADIETLFGTGLVRQHQYLRIQSADIVMTRQWQLSCKLASSCNRSSAGTEAANLRSDALGVVAMSWICLLKEGDLRIVGLGKIVGLVMNIFQLGGVRKHQDVLRGLVGAVMREDHERLHAQTLSELVFPMLQGVPPCIDSQGNRVEPSLSPNALRNDLDTHSLGYSTHGPTCVSPQLESTERQGSPDVQNLDLSGSWDIEEWLIC